MSLRASHPASLALLALVGAGYGGCEPTTGPRTGGQTNWLRVCRSDADCGDLECLCGACTRACSRATSCDDLPDTNCVRANDVGAVALCGGTPPPREALCLERCDDGECPDGSACVAGVCSPQPVAEVHVTVDDTDEHQTLIGFGATVGYMNDDLAAHPRRTALLDAMFADAGTDVLRLRNQHGAEGANDLTSTVTVVDGATASLGRRPLLILFSASPPNALKANGSQFCVGNPDTCTLSRAANGGFDYAGFANHWRESLDAYAAVGLEPDYITIQTNPNWLPSNGNPIESCRFLPTEGTEVVDVNGSSVTVSYPGYVEALSAIVQRLSGLANMPQIAAPDVTDPLLLGDYAQALDLSTIGALSHKLYWIDPADPEASGLGEVRDLAAQAGLPILQTEMQADGLETAVLMHVALAVEGVAAYLQNDFVTSATSLQPNPLALVSVDASDFTLQPAYYAIRHFARHTDPGWVRVSADVDADAPLVTAWRSPDGDALTVVIVNPEVDSFALELGLDSADAVSSEVSRTTFDGLERATELGALPDDRVVRIPGHSVVTVALTY
jgi:hypothetical protein